MTDLTFAEIDVPSLAARLRLSSCHPLTKGWSRDLKFCVTRDDQKLLLRLSPMYRVGSRMELFTLMQKISKLGIPICEPIEIGAFEHAYSLHSWLNGDDLEDVLLQLTSTEQYVLGLYAGQYLKKIHSLAAPSSLESWGIRFGRKLNTRLQKYHEAGVRFEGDEAIIAYIEQNRQLINDRPQCFQHGDYHVGNMMLVDNELHIIDFDRFDYGDPWEEFNRISWSAQLSPHFATGQIRGYFGGEPPQDFFRLLALYMGSNTLGSIYWALDYDDQQLQVMLKQAADTLAWFDNMQNPVPSWYLSHYYIQWQDGIPYQLHAPFDFSFLSDYGQVFHAFDQQGSGNISFGISKDNQRYFLKFAGAPCPNYIAHRDNGTIDPDSAIALLKSAVSLYENLAHPNLINFISAKEVGKGFASLFAWSEASSIAPYNSPAHRKFLNLPPEEKIKAFEDILHFHAHVASKGYVALDFYDSSILYDYNLHKVIICDIDLYQHSPFANTDGLGLVGSYRYVSPEEHIDDAILDEITNVYTMGATAFSLFANGERAPEAWPLNPRLYDVVRKAVSYDRMARQQSIEQLIVEWQEAKAN